MKIIDKYLSYKEDNKDKVVLLNSGLFYYTYFDDALIMNKIFNYQIINNRVGFPQSNINKVIEELKGFNISIFDVDNNTSYNFINNEYYKVLEEAHSKYIKNNDLKELMDIIKIKLNKDYNNFNLIMEYLNEL